MVSATGVLSHQKKERNNWSVKYTRYICISWGASSLSGKSDLWRHSWVGGIYFFVTNSRRPHHCNFKTSNTQLITAQLYSINYGLNVIDAPHKGQQLNKHEKCGMFSGDHGDY